MAYVPSVYIETSVISTLTAREPRDPEASEQQRITRIWWSNVLPRVRPYVSPAVYTEAARGDAGAAAKRLEALAEIDALSGGPAIKELAGIYLTRGLIPQSSSYDALHLAYATEHGIDYLLTWNCRQLAAAVVRKRLSALHAELGRSTPILCTPSELMEI